MSTSLDGLSSEVMGLRPEFASRSKTVLTARERDCLVLSGKGLSEKEVALRLGISPNTVRVHIENIKRKLGAENKTHAIVLSLAAGETDIGDFIEGWGIR